MVNIWGWSGNQGTLGIFLAMGSFFLLKRPILFVAVVSLIILTKSITAILALAIGLLFYYKRKLPNKVYNSIVCGVIVCVLLFIGFVKPIRFNRFDIWSQIVGHINIVGQGIGKLTELGIKDGITPVTMAHNDFLEIALDLGIIGLVLFVGFIVERFRFYLRQDNTDLQLAMISALIVYLVSSLFWFSMHLAQLSFYAIIIWGCLEYSYEKSEA